MKPTASTAGTAVRLTGKMPVLREAGKPVLVRTGRPLCFNEADQLDQSALLLVGT